VTGVLRAVLVATLSAAAFVVSAEPTSAAGCHHPRGPFRVAGGHMVTGTGARFTPYGLNMTKLGAGGEGLAEAEAQADAAAGGWCANLVRTIVTQERLVVGGQVVQPYLDAVRAEVDHAAAAGLVVVVAMDQASALTPRLPVAKTLQAWQALAPLFGDPQVILDIFNEPGGPWRLWRNGGRPADGVYRYGMQRLASWLRGHGARNLLWVEGLRRGGSLTGIPRWRLSGVGPLAYAEHRPISPHTRRSWDRTFGHLVGHWPVVEGEWANYSRPDAPWACWPDGRRSIGRFLRYLADRRIGLVGYNLGQPRLLQSASLDDPNHVRASWACRNGLNQGAGNQIRNWLRARGS
jgi:hypothetical protein